jgi:hypothetical protein
MVFDGKTRKLEASLEENVKLAWLSIRTDYAEDAHLRSSDGGHEATWLMNFTQADALTRR